jgi:hypothetical protein
VLLFLRLFVTISIFFIFLLFRNFHLISRKTCREGTSWHTYVDVDERTILKWKLKRTDLKTWIGFIWFRLGWGVGCCEQGTGLRWLSSGMLRRVVLYKLADSSEVLTASIIRAMSHRPGDNQQVVWMYIARIRTEVCHWFINPDSFPVETKLL